MIARMPVFKSQLRRIIRLLRNRGATPEDAEDLVQEAVLRLHIYARTGNEVRDPESFVKRAALNLAIDAHRHAHAELYESTPVEELTIVDVGAAPDEVLSAEQRLLQMRDALDRASVRTREVFFMHRLQGLSHAEIADKLKISKSAVEKHIASAVTILAIERQSE
jgi:RNA polymerase sigma factor (sigma-70 family)